MYKNLLICVIVFVFSLVLTSCSTKSKFTNLSDWANCTSYCAGTYCTMDISVMSLDPNNYPTITKKKVMNPECFNKCSLDCATENSEVVKRWKWWKQNLQKLDEIDNDVSGDN